MIGGELRLQFAPWQFLRQLPKPPDRAGPSCLRHSAASWAEGEENNSTGERWPLVPLTPFYRNNLTQLPQNPKKRQAGQQEPSLR